MRLKTMGCAGLAMLAIGCSAASADQPTKEQMAEAIQGAFDSMFLPRLGQKVEVQAWDDLEVDCEPLPGDVQRLRCEANGKMTIAGYQNGVQTKEGAREVTPDWYFIFEKRGEGQWVATDFDLKKK
jgi:hypothetical protein